MNTQIMNYDVHSPVFIQVKTTHNKPQTAKSTRGIDWRRGIELMLLLSLVVVAIYFIAKLVTPELVRVVSILAGLLLLRFIVRTLLQITFTILGILFWLAILSAIVICLL